MLHIILDILYGLVIVCVALALLTLLAWQEKLVAPKPINRTSARYVMTHSDFLDLDYWEWNWPEAKPAYIWYAEAMWDSIWLRHLVWAHIPSPPWICGLDFHRLYGANYVKKTWEVDKCSSSDSGSPS